MVRTAVLNLSDIPEMLLGARSGANPAQREEFERTSRRLYEEEVEERSQEQAASRALGRVDATCNELEDIFPTLDPELVRVLRAEAPSMQHAIETLLALAVATAEPGGGDEATLAADLPPREVGIQDHSKFPSLVDADGWQVPAARLEADEDLGSAWRDCAREAAEKLAPKPSSRPPVVWGPKKKQGRQRETELDEQVQPLTDYDCRHRAGQRRAQQRVQYGRGGSSGAGHGIVGGGRSVGRGGESDAESEEQGEEIDLSTV